MRSLKLGNVWVFVLLIFGPCWTMKQQIPDSSLEPRVRLCLYIRLLVLWYLVHWWGLPKFVIMLSIVILSDCRTHHPSLTVGSLSCRTTATPNTENACRTRRRRAGTAAAARRGSWEVFNSQGGQQSSQQSSHFAFQCTQKMYNFISICISNLNFEEFKMFF